MELVQDIANVVVNTVVLVLWSLLNRMTVFDMTSFARVYHGSWETAAGIRQYFSLFCASSVLQKMKITLGNS